MKRVLVTGGAGFIGSALCRHLAGTLSWTVVNLDKLTYAGNLASLKPVESLPNYHFFQGDIADSDLVARLLREYQIEAVIHLAAESHVDRSISGSTVFFQTNVMGTLYLIEACRHYWEKIPGSASSSFRFHHVSTDEVFGDLDTSEPPFTEQTPYAPSSPYSASKAASDHIVRAWHRTYGLPVTLSNCSNNYGPYHYPEKLIPLAILNALSGRSIPVYGTGHNIRDWLFVEDHAEALARIVELGNVGQSYNVGGNQERTNLEVVSTICSILDDLRPGEQRHGRLIKFVEDRKGHDRRYAIDGRKLQHDLDWHPRTGFEDGLRATVQWYLENQNWWRPLVSPADLKT
tara:strand:- start:10181 stop:11218 length:1038 start_codon:yes stop_codon:yes gene_type:complete